MKKKQTESRATNREARKPELVAPAGDWASLNSAIEAGADSVYFGIKGLNMRRSAGNFDMLEMMKVMDALHKSGVKGYLVLNVIVYENELAKVRRIIKKASKAKVDGVVLWDMAVMKIALEEGLKVHLSTQASVSNFEALSFFASLGVRRTVLARECSLKDIRSIAERIKQNKLDMEIETFVHGAMCVSISGRCFLSQHSFLKSANRGECLQPCRRKFRIKDIDGESEYVLGEDYLLSPKDLCTISIIDKLIESGISAFKIEGRMRSPEYVKVVTSIYAEAIDLYYKKELTKKKKEDLLNRLKEVYNRGLAPGFFLGEPDQWITDGLKHEYEKTYVGEVVKYYKKINVAEVIINTGLIRTGGTLLVSGNSTGAFFFNISEMEIDHRAIKKASKGEKIAIKVPQTVRKNDKVYLWSKK